MGQCQERARFYVAGAENQGPMRSLEQTKDSVYAAFGHNCNILLDSCGYITFGHDAPANTTQRPAPTAACSSLEKRSKLQDVAQRPSVVSVTTNTIRMQHTCPG